MNCPSCNIPVTEDAFICSNCDHILDTSFLGTDITNELEPSKRKAPPMPASEPMPLSSDHRLARLDTLTAPSANAAEAIDDLIADFKSLSSGRRMTISGALGVILSLALPWQATAKGDSTIGLVGGGGLVGLIAALVLAAIFGRKNKWLAPYRMQMLIGTTVASAFVGLLCVRFMRNALEYQIVVRSGLRIRENTAWPSLGLYLGFACALLMLGGALKTWLERNR